jgi:hypothetical protein
VQQLDDALANCEAAGDWDMAQAESWWSGTIALDVIDPAAAMPTVPAQRV